MLRERKDLPRSQSDYFNTLYQRYQTGSLRQEEFCLLKDVRTLMPVYVSKLEAQRSAISKEVAKAMQERSDAILSQIGVLALERDPETNEFAFPEKSIARSEYGFSANLANFRRISRLHGISTALVKHASNKNLAYLCVALPEFFRKPTKHTVKPKTDRKRKREDDYDDYTEEPVKINRASKITFACAKKCNALIKQLGKLFNTTDFTDYFFRELWDDIKEKWRNIKSYHVLENYAYNFDEGQIEFLDFILEKDFEWLTGNIVNFREDLKTVFFDPETVALSWFPSQCQFFNPADDRRVIEEMNIEPPKSPVATLR